MSKAAISKIHQSADALHVDWQDGRRSVFHYIWLRDNDSRVDDPADRLTIKLGPGVLFVDNLRILHGRLAYESGSAERLLQGCFSDQYSFWSKLAVLERQARST